MSKDQPTANDNKPADENAISITDLAKMSGIDEDVLLMRLAGILNRRAETDDKERIPTDHPQDKRPANASSLSWRKEVATLDG